MALSAEQVSKSLLNVCPFALCSPGGVHGSVCGLCPVWFVCGGGGSKQIRGTSELVLVSDAPHL